MDVMGFRTYQKGYQPRENSTVSNVFGGPRVWREMGGFNIWKTPVSRSI